MGLFETLSTFTKTLLRFLVWLLLILWLIMNTISTLSHILEKKKSSISSAVVFRSPSYRKLTPNRSNVSILHNRWKHNLEKVYALWRFNFNTVKWALINSKVNLKGLFAIIIIFRHKPLGSLHGTPNINTTMLISTELDGYC